MNNRADNWKPKTKRQKRYIKETLTDTTLTDYDGEFRCLKTMRTARPWLPAREKKNLRKERFSKYRGLNQPFVNYMLGCPDLIEKVDEFLTRAKINSTKPPIEISFIVDLLQKGRFKPETYLRQVILPDAPRSKSDYLKQVASVEPFTII